MIARDVTLAIDVACWFWKRHNLNAIADLDDVRAVTMKVNGGLNGFGRRRVDRDAALHEALARADVGAEDGRARPPRDAK